MTSARRCLLHPLIFAAYPLLFFCLRNNLSIFSAQSLKVLGMIVLSSALLLTIASRCLKSTLAGANLTSVYLVGIFSYGHIFDSISGLTFAGMRIGSHRVLLTIYVLIIILVTLILRRRAINQQTVSEFLLYVSVCLLVISVLGLTRRAIQGVSWNAMRDAALQHVSDLPAVPPDATGAKPNIYYVILDAYANNSTLKQVYDYDNGKFLERLGQKGFFASELSTCNYASTALSLASSLNMQYLDKLGAGGGNRSRDETLLYPLISNNTVGRLLKKQGYEYLHFDSGWAVTSDSEGADRVIRCGGLSEAQTVFLRTTIFNPFVQRLSVAGLRERVLCAFERLTSFEDGSKGPYFIVAHIVSPHPPFVFAADGSMPTWQGLGVTPKGVWRESFKRAYIAQLAFINEKVLDFVDTVQSRSSGSAIIVIQGDHGPAFPTDLEVAPTREIVRERMGILNAIYVPNRWKCDLYERITPVNTFRVIFDGCFGAGYEKLEDRSFYSTIGDPYRFTDVTEGLQGKRP